MGSRTGGVLVVLTLALNHPMAARAQDTGGTVPLTSEALVADLDAPLDPDDPGTGGGFEIGAYFQTRLTDGRAIRSCADTIERAAGGWATDQGLSVALRERTDVGLTLHYVKPGVPGFFSVIYRVERQVRARVRVDYIALDGTRRSPELALELIDTFHIAAAQKAMDAAVRCGGGAS